MKKDKKRKIKTERLLFDEVITIHKSKGNGILKRYVMVNEDDEVTRYSLAYINHNIHGGDNGRVLGYDNAHNYHHRHYMGEVEPIDFKNFEDIENRFQQEFEVIYEKCKKKK
jgi:hypothetical protein